MMKRLSIENPLSTAPVYFTEHTDSTMTDAAELLSTAGFPGVHGTAIIAGYQSNGRGRKPDRAWMADSGENLLCTMILDSRISPMSPTLMPTMVGLAVSDYLLNSLGLTAHIKWPNDILVEGRKICGILCEMRGHWILAGVGLNVAQTVFPANLRTPPCSITSVTGSAPAPLQCYAGIAAALAQRLDTVANPTPNGKDGVRTALDDVRRRVYGLGRHVVITSAHGEQVAAGRLIGIGSEGQALVESAGGQVENCYGGEMEFSKA